MPQTTDKEKSKQGPATPRPSSSIILLSPTNQILLLHRVQTSSSFASAHVFPGGNLSSFHEDKLPGSLAQHEDSEPYRLAAVRETFEESGILLARPIGSGPDAGLLTVPDDVREAGRKEVHANKVNFTEWLERVGGVADTTGLHPFTRWITPTTNTKRFTTQMYLYMLPLSASSPSAAGAPSSKHAHVIPAPTHDGGLEHTAASFEDASAWLARCRAGEITLYPPQYYLMSLIEQFTSEAPAAASSAASHYGSQREALLRFLKRTPTVREGADARAQGHATASIPWAEKVMSPSVLFMRSSDRRVVLALDKPGPELSGSKRGGDYDRVVLVQFKKDGPQGLELTWRDEAVAEQRAAEKIQEQKDAKL